MSLIKYGFSADENMDNVVELKYANEYAIEKTTESERLVVSLENGQVNMMLDLLKGYDNCKYFILYVLVVSRCDNKLGRYQIENLITWEELNVFCNKYSKYLETDGRHHFWIVNYDTKDLVVYDQHNVLYVYGDIESKIKVLENNGYKKVDEINFSIPHIHCYNEENDYFENEIIKNNKWITFPLKERDEYNY